MEHLLEANSMKVGEKMLTVGTITSQELANWFGVSYSTFRKKRKERLKELELFADFEEFHGGVEIKEVRIPEYSKTGSNAYNIIKECFDNTWHKSGYDTAARIGSQIWKSNPELQKLISERTAKAYVARVRKEKYGRAYVDEYGTEGLCYYAYVKTNGWEEAILLTEEQSTAIDKIKREIYTNEQEPYVYEAWNKKEISDEQYEQFWADWKNGAQERYFTFIDRVSNILGFCPDKVTKVEKVRSFE